MKTSIIFDFNRTLYDPDMKALVPSALLVLQELHARGHRLFLVSRKENNREGLVKDLGIDIYFADIAFLAEKTKETLEAFMQKNGIEESSFMVGDRIREEIAIGNTLGMQTIWFQGGKFAIESPRSKEEEPTFHVTNLKEILTIIL